MKNSTCRFIEINLVSLILTLPLSACAPTESNLSNMHSERTLQRLQAAREIDLGNARDPDVGPVASGDYSLRADKAEQVMYDLEHGQYVSQSQVNDALFVPPKSLSLEQRAYLIRELKLARNRDEQGWWDDTRDPIAAQDFAVQEKKANRAQSGICKPASRSHGQRSTTASRYLDTLKRVQRVSVRAATRLKWDRCDQRRCLKTHIAFRTVWLGKLLR